MAMKISLPNEGGQVPPTSPGGMAPGSDDWWNDPAIVEQIKKNRELSEQERQAKQARKQARWAAKKKKKGKGGGAGQSPGGPLPPAGSPLQPAPSPSFQPGFQPAQVTNPGIGHWYNQDFPQFQVPSYGPDPMDRRPYSGMGGGGAYGDFNDVYNMYLSTVPIMEAERDRQINSAMASAGFGGTRYGSAAMERAGQIGADTAMQQNQLLNTLLYTQANRDLDRQMQAIPLEMQLGQMIEQGSMNRLGALGGFGQWEQGRMDDMAMNYYRDFEANKYGFLPMLLQAATSQGAGYPGQPGSIAQIMTSPGSEPDIPPEILTGILGLFL